MTKDKTVTMPRELESSESHHEAVKALHDIMQAVPCNSLYSLAEAVLDAGYAAPVVERQPVCGHEWTDDGQFMLICTKCGSQENHDPKWRDMATAPKDGTLVRLLVEFEDHSTEDESEAPTIGANNFDNDEHDEWLFAGWCWTHDHWTQGKGTPIGWLPMIDTSPPAPPAPVAVVLPDRLSWSGIASWKQRAEITAWNACLDKVKELNQ